MSEWPRCWQSPRLARHSPVHPLLVPHTTPLLLLLLLVVVVVDVVVAAWVLWRVWPLGPPTGCAGAVHAPATHTLTHTRGGGHVVVVAVCVVWLPPPLCPIPTNHHHCVRCPALSAVCVRVRGGTRHSGALWWHPRWCVCVWLCVRRAHHTHHPRCPPLSPLSPRSPHPTPATHTHTWHASRHTHTWRALCASSHPLTHTLAASLPTRPTHTHATGCACAHPPALIRHHSHTRDAQAWRMHGWLGVWSPPPRPLCPPLTHSHSHSGTGGGRHGGAWWCGCGLCVPPTPPTTTPSLPPPPPTLLCHRLHTHTHGTWWMHHCHTHTPHAPPHSPTRAVWCPHHATHSHTPPATHTHNGACHRSPRRPHSHTQRMPHTHHTGEGPRARTPVGVAFGEPPPPRWSWAFAVLCWWLLVHQPLFTLTHPSTPTPSSPNHHHHHHPIHPVCGVWCVVWERTAPGTTVVVKHATHTPVVHCVHGSHHPTLHPPLTPLLVLFPPPTTTPSLFSTHHHTHTPQGHCGHPLPTLLPHTHTWCGWHVALWLLSRAVCE